METMQNQRADNKKFEKTLEYLIAEEFTLKELKKVSGWIHQDSLNTRNASLIRVASLVQELQTEEMGHGTKLITKEEEPERV